MSEQAGVGTPRPGGWDGDLSQMDVADTDRAGLNAGVRGAHPEKRAATAYDLKDLHAGLRDFPDDELKRIPILPAGSRLEQGATYLDLADPQRREFRARAGMEAAANDRYVPKTEVDYQLWNRLIGVDNPERTGDADEP